jgi:hypothetical protein
MTNKITIDKTKLINNLKTLDKNLLNSIALKVLVSQLQTAINYANNVNEDELVMRFEDFLEKYYNLDSVQKDLKQYFGIDLQL